MIPCDTPNDKKQIRAVFDDKTIRVYQAFSAVIANEAVLGGTFGEHFSLSRMTWIKPSFLWMMYRCGWAEKSGQERVLAIDIKRAGFNYAVKNAVPSTLRESGMSEQVWRAALKASDIRVQWDPERDVEGRPLDFRSLQLGLRGDAVREYVRNWIVNISDITDYAKELNSRRKNGEDILHILPLEKIYVID